MAADPKAKRLIDRAEALKSERRTFESHWDEVRELMAATAPSFTSTTSTPGEKRHQQIFDNTGEMAADNLASALYGSLTGPAAPWFLIRAVDDTLNDDQECAGWLEHATERMYTAFNAPVGNFKAQIHEVYADEADFGTAGLYVEDAPGQGVLFSARPLRELYLAEDRAGRIDTVMRRFRFSARQAVQEYGDQVGDKIAKAAADATQADKVQFEFLHAIFPREDRDRRRADGANLPFASCHVAMDDQLIVRESGYHEWPLMVPRWSKRSGEVYGRGPGMRALADCKTLQRAMRVTMRGAEKVIDPALLVADDGVVSNEIRTAPSAINIVRAELMTGQQAPIRPLNTGARPDIGEDLMVGVRQRIEAAYYYNLLQIMRDPKMTATQVNAILEEIARILGPTLGRLETELLDPMIRRVYGIMLRMGAFLPMPKKLQGRGLKIEYVSPLAKAQRAAATSGIARTYEMGGMIAQVAPEVLDNLDHDGALRRAADRFGFPKDLMRTPQQVEQIRAARAQARQQQAQDAAMVQAGETGAKVAQALPALRQALQPAEAAP